MKITKRFLALFLTMTMVLGFSTFAKAEDDDLLIYMLGMENQYDVWLAMKGGGIARAEEDESVELIYQAAPNGEIDIQGQIALVETAINAEADAIVISPNDKEGLVDAVAAAKDAGLKVVLFISGLASDTYDASVAFDNYLAAQDVAKDVCEKIGTEEEAQVGFIGAVTGSSTLSDREAGYRDYIAENYPNISFVGEALYSQGDVQKAMNCTYDLLAQYPDIKAIFTVNTATCEGVGTALVELGRTDIMVTSFDPSETIIQYIEDGVVNALSCFDATRIGYTAVDVAIALCRGEEVEGLDENNFLNIPPSVITPENIEDEDMQKLLYPTLAEQ